MASLLALFPFLTPEEDIRFTTAVGPLPPITPQQLYELTAVMRAPGLPDETKIEYIRRVAHGQADLLQDNPLLNAEALGFTAEIEIQTSIADVPDHPYLKCLRCRSSQLIQRAGFGVRRADEQMSIKFECAVCKEVLTVQ